MSIQNERVKEATNRLLKENLQNGILPDSREFIWQLNQAMRDMRFNKPSFQFSPYRNTEIASSNRLNKNNEAIYSDLLALYKNMTNVYQLLNKQYQHFTIERDKLEKDIDVLENELIEFVRNNNRPGLLPYAYDTFDTVEKVDISQTSGIFVDTQSNEARLVEEKNTSTRILPKGDVQFEFSPNGTDKKEETLVGKLSDIFTDSLDDGWQKRYLLKENLSVEGKLTINFESEQVINHIHSTFFTIKPFQLTVSYTPDGHNWYRLPYHEDTISVSKKVELKFPDIQVKSLSFVIGKTEYDESFPEEENYNFQYLFGVQKVAFYQKSYPTAGSFYTNKIKLENAPENYLVDTVQLIADETLPTGTNIRYEVALPDATLDWQPIDPINREHPKEAQTIHFNRLTRNAEQTLFFPEEFSIRQSEAEDLLKNGIPLYRLSSIQNSKQVFELPKIQMVEGSTRLYVGKESWEVTSYPSNDVETIPQISDFQSVKDGTRTVYEDISRVQSGDVFKNKKEPLQKKYLARLALYIDEPKSLSSPIVSTEPLALFLNGEQLFIGNTQSGDIVHYVFQQGWNEIVVLINGINAPTVNGMTVSLGFNPLNVSETIYANSNNLREISVFDLQYNTKINDNTVFAKRETEKGLEILTNFGQPGMAFDLVYDYKDSIDTEDGLYLRAFFERENGQNVPTPVLKKYRLDFS